MTYECIGERSNKPYIIRDTQTGVYSIEELLYYIRENIFMLDPADYGKPLAAFLRKELKLQDIGEKYSSMLEEERSFADRICMLYSHTGFAGEAETETIRKALTMSEHMSNNDSHRVKGDFYLRNGRTPEAVIEYNAALSLIDESQDPCDAAKLLAGIGSAAARNFKFDRAREYFEHAHSLMPEDPGILDKLIAAARMEMKDDRFLEYMKERGIAENIYEKVLEKMKNAENKALKTGSAKILLKARKARKDGNYSEYVRLRKEVLKDWKKAYRH